MQVNTAGLPPVPPAPESASSPASASGGQDAGAQPVLALPEAQSSPPPAADAQAQEGAPANPPADGGTGDIVITARPKVPADPLQSVNIETFSAVQTVDKAVTGPVAREYKRSVPGPIRSGLRNFLGNLQEPVVFLNYLLQIKPGKGAETFWRFVVNSTVGIGGLFDVAKTEPFDLPRRNNGFAYTLGYYGVKPGPFLYLPLIGPTTLRDVSGRLVDLSVLPFAVGKPFSEPTYAIPTTVVRLVDERAEAEEETRVLRDQPDPYATLRESYLRQRQAEIDALHGKHHSKGAVPGAESPTAPAPDATPPSGQEQSEGVAPSRPE